MVVPRAKIAEFVKAAKSICLSHGVVVEPCGHAGDGNIHTEMLRQPGMTDEEWKSATHACLVELYAKSKELGGQLSGGGRHDEVICVGGEALFGIVQQLGHAHGGGALQTA